MRLKIWAVLVLSLSLLAAACGNAGESATESVEEQAVSATVDVPDTGPNLSPGGVSTGEVEIDGTSLSYAVNVPDDFVAGDVAPLLLAFPGGSQSLDGVLAIMQGTYAAEAQRLGWVVVSPAAPDGVRFFDGSETLLPGFVDWIETWVVPEGGAPHVIGPSNGGISSFRYAIANPDRAQSVVVFPGFPRGDADRAALGNIADIPVRLYAGETDTQWVENGETTFATLTELGGDVELTVFDGEAHFPESTRNGVVLFEELESFR